MSQSEVARLLKRSKGAILAGLSGLVWPARQAGQAGPRPVWPGQARQSGQACYAGPSRPASGLLYRRSRTVKNGQDTVKTRSRHGQDKRESNVIPKSKWPKMSPGGLAGTEILLLD